MKDKKRETRVLNIEKHLALTSYFLFMQEKLRDDKKYAGKRFLTAERMERQSI